jgi:hypothetical protein
LRHPLTFRRLCTSLLAHGNSWQPLPSPLVLHFLGVNGSWWQPLQFHSLSVLNGRSGQLMTFSLRPSSLPISGSSFQLIAVTTTALQTHRAIDFAAIVVRDTVSQTKVPHHIWHITVVMSSLSRHACSLLIQVLHNMMPKDFLRNCLC